MREEDISRIEAWFDGETSSRESRAVQELLDTNPDAQRYLHELESARAQLRMAHPEAPAPVSWEQLRARSRARVPKHTGKFLSFPRMITTLAAVLILGTVLWYPLHNARRVVAPPMSLNSSVELVETDLEGATSVVYLDQPSGWTVVWVVEDNQQTGI